ncbi:MAG: FtsX-like permease family protein [Bacteroidota bacterium]
MILNYIKIAWRNLLKNKTYSLINILGLSLAIPFALLSFMQLAGTFEIDNFHNDTDRIYRIITDETTTEGNKTSYASSPFLLAENLKNNYPAIENATKIRREFSWELNNRLKTLRVNTLFIEPSFVEIFNFKLAAGSLPIEPNTLIISNEMAKSFFGEDTNPVGKTLNHQNYGAFKITGVLKPFKRNTQFRSDVMISMATYNQINKEAKSDKSWGEYEMHTFVKLQKSAKPQSLDLAIHQMAQSSNESLKLSKKSNQFRKQAFNDISPAVEELSNNPYVESMTDIIFNFSIPLMIILLAGFNYTNLTLARSLSRSKEVGVRKVMGAFRWQIVFQFICEAIIIAFIALFLGFVFLQIMKEFIQINWVTWEVENQYLIWLLFVGFAIFLGAAAGAMPAWILSNFNPASVLKGVVSPASFGKISFRKSLIVIQFVVSMVFIFWIGHLYNQFKYMATENENYNRKGIFNITLADNKYQLMIDEISKNKNVGKIGITSQPFGGITAQNGIKAHINDENQATYYYSADKSYIENMHLKFVAGNNIPESKSDSTSNFILVNEKAVQSLRLGTPQEAIGKTIFLNNKAEMRISGVLQNFCHYNYQFEIQPLVFQYNPSQFHIISIQTNKNTDEAQFLSEIKALWKKHYPYEQMVSSWYEKELYEHYYPAEDMKIMGMASAVILIIAVMGLFGIVIYSTEKRTKEIGIRKVMGASEWQIVNILSKSFMKLLLIASLISIPIGYFSGFVILKLFVFHTKIDIGMMGLFYGVIFLIAMFTIGIYTYRASLMNPAKSLKVE